MENLFKNASSHWVRYSEYEWKTDKNNTLYLTPTENAQASIYNPLSEYQNLILDAIDIGRMDFYKKTPQDIKRAIQLFAIKYGLLGIMTALPITPNFVSYKTVFLPKNRFIQKKSLSTKEYLSYFFPFAKSNTLIQESSSTILEPIITLPDKPMAVNMTFQKEYAEPYEWIKHQFNIIAFTYLTSLQHYDKCDENIQKHLLLEKQDMEDFINIAPTYHISFLDKPTIVWNFDSLILGIKMIFSLMLTSTENPIRICKHCLRTFIISRPNSIFCSPQCKNKFNVYKTRNKIKNKENTKMPECQNLEWKSKWKDAYLEWICGYANAQGGKIYIGCDDNGNIVGLPNARKLLEDIPNKIRESMGIIVNVNLYKEKEKEYIEIDVPPYPIGISCKGIYYYRSGSTRQILTGPALEAFLMRKRGATWDNLPLPALSLNDIDDSIIDQFKKWATKKGRLDASVLNESKEVLLEKLNLTNGSYLTNAAMLLFSKNPERWQLGAYVKIGFFESDADLLYQDEVHGSILEQVDKIIELIYLKYMKAKISYEGLQRIERYFVPEEALREALLNAICHKHYQTGIPIQISVYKNKLYIANCGCLPENWTLENLINKHASNPYNPNIAHVFYLAGFIESWGRGIEKICSACEKNHVPLPIYTINPSDIMIKFTAPEDDFYRSNGQYVSEKVTENVTDKVTEKVTDNLDTKSLQILKLISQNPTFTSTIISEKLLISRKTVSLRLQKMKELGIINRIGSDRKGYWKVNIN